MSGKRDGKKKPPISSGFKSARRLWEEAVAGSPAPPPSHYAPPRWGNISQPPALDVPKSECTTEA